MRFATFIAKGQYTCRSAVPRDGQVLGCTLDRPSELDTLAQCTGRY